MIKTYKDYIGNRIAEYLKNSSHNIKLASCIGYRSNVPFIDYDWHDIGILKNDAVKRWFRRKTRRTFVGVLWVLNKIRNANPGSKLIFEVHGEDNLEFAKCICDDITNRFGIPIDICILNGRVCETKEARDGDNSL